MGQQQLLLVIVGVIVVGIAIVAGINLFVSSAIDTKRNNLVNDCVHLASAAQQYYRKPAALGGGSDKFTGWSIPVDLQANDNGRFEAVVYSDSVVITAVGNEVVTGDDSVSVSISVMPSSYRVSILK